MTCIIPDYTSGIGTFITTSFINFNVPYDKNMDDWVFVYPHEVNNAASLGHPAKIHNSPHEQKLFPCLRPHSHATTCLQDNKIVSAVHILHGMPF